MTQKLKSNQCWLLGRHIEEPSGAFFFSPDDFWRFESEEAAIKAVKKEAKWLIEAFKESGNRGYEIVRVQYHYAKDRTYAIRIAYRQEDESMKFAIVQTLMYNEWKPIFDPVEDKSHENLDSPPISGIR